MSNNNWVSVDDYLPQIDFDVIVCEGDDVFTDILRSGAVDGEYWFDSEISRGYTITHWQPLPKPPEGLVQALYTVDR
jgi:hypothetical protein